MPTTSKMVCCLVASQAVYAEVGQVVSVRRVPTVATELIGSGVMEWSRERDRYLNVSEGATPAPGRHRVPTSFPCPDHTPLGLMTLMGCLLAGTTTAHPELQSSPKSSPNPNPNPLGCWSRAGGHGLAHQRADARRCCAVGRRPDALLVADALPHHRGGPEAHVAPPMHGCSFVERSSSSILSQWGSGSGSIAVPAKRVAHWEQAGRNNSSGRHHFGRSVCL